MNFFDMIFRLLIAAILGGIIGWERSQSHKPAGFRTHTLVSLGSALFMVLSLFMHREFQGDPGRIAAQVVTGIGFIGAGTIWVSGASVHGLTTAASLWTASGVGLAIGCGYYSAGIFATLIVLATLVILSRLESRHKGPHDQDEP